MIDRLANWLYPEIPPDLRRRKLFMHCLFGLLAGVVSAAAAYALCWAAARIPIL